jgi:transposase
LDLRERVLETVETGASRREAAERFEVSPQACAQSSIAANTASVVPRRAQGSTRRSEGLAAG